MVPRAVLTRPTKHATLWLDLHSVACLCFSLTLAQTINSVTALVGGVIATQDQPIKIDFDYLKALLENFEACKKPYPLVSEIALDKTEIDAKLAFHVEMLMDQGFLVSYREDGNSPFEPDYENEEGFSFLDLEVRLTAQGYEFLSALKQKNIFNAIKEDLKENSIGTIWKVAQGALTKIASEKIMKYVNAEDI